MYFQLFGRSVSKTAVSGSGPTGPWLNLPQQRSVLLQIVLACNVSDCESFVWPSAAINSVLWDVIIYTNESV